MRQPFLALLLGISFILALLGGCLGGSSGGSSYGGTEPGNDYTEPPEPEPLMPTLSSIQRNVFTPSCSSCHSGETAEEGLRLESGQSHAHLVGVESNQVELYRVDPGNPDDSYLIHKLEGSQAVGERMPKEGSPLSQSDINVIRQWISDGAEARASNTASGLASVSSAWPVGGSLLEQPPRHIILIFDQEMDASLLHSESVKLQYLNESNPSHPVMRVVEDVELRITRLSPTTTVTLSVPDSRWLSGHYRVLVHGTGPHAVATRQGEWVDGNGDGTPGGDFSSWFELQ